jgi:hypothetical protein
VKTQSAILMFLAVALIGGIAFDVGRDAMRQGQSSDVLTTTQTVHQSCVGLNLLSCNALLVSTQKSEVGLYGLVMAVVIIAAIGLYLTVRSDQGHA